jgi:LmbE family N-acetylglucosaminyl deacetylase
MSTRISGAGTTESDWQQWLGERPFPPLDLSGVAGRRVVVVAAHPDDEVLGIGGLMTRLQRLGCKLQMVWATDGEASHPGSTVFSPDQLAQIRRAESRRALARLGVQPTASFHFGLPDSALSTCRASLRSELSHIINPDDIVIAPWEYDGHPDHEVAGETALAVAPQTWRYPIWMWHWATPTHPNVPWDHFQSVDVEDPLAKSAAIGEFISQVAPLGEAPEDAAILPPHIVSRFTRSAEWIIT